MSWKTDQSTIKVDKPRLSRQLSETGLDRKLKVSGNQLEQDEPRLERYCTRVAEGGESKL